MIFIIETTRSGTIEASLLKSLPIPENEFTGTCLEIVLIGSYKVYLRDDSNAYEISLEAEVDNNSLSDHNLNINISLTETVLTILSRQDIIHLDIRSVLYQTLLKERDVCLESAFSILDEYRTSVDIYAYRSIFSAFLRLRFEKAKFSDHFIKELADYELISSYKSDSQVFN